MKLVIKPNEQDGRKGLRLTANDYKYFISTGSGEIELTNHITKLKLSMGTYEPNLASVDFLLDDIDVDANFLAEMKIHIKQKEEEDNE